MLWGIEGGKGLTLTFHPRGANRVPGHVYPGRRYGDAGCPALYGVCVSHLESPPPVDQGNLGNQSVHGRRHAGRHFWVDDGGVT